LPTKSLGGGSSAVAASAHAACARFRGTDPLVTGVTRRKLAREVGFADESGRIPEARWMRAMTFERLVRDVRFASEVATTTVGRLGLTRPTEVVTVNAHVDVARTAHLLSAAHSRAVGAGAATLLHGLAVPFVGYEDVRATDVKPDFAVVAPTADGTASWLVVGDAKDYERVRSRVDDARLLKGFLQVAVGAESCAAWSLLPSNMTVHDHGVLAVPRNAFLQPEALVELITDHRAEVRRWEAESRSVDDGDLPAFVAHLVATFDPASCTTCPLFPYCRDELRRSDDPSAVLVEIGVARDLRPQVVGLVDGTGILGTAPASVLANVVATIEGVGQPTGQLRVDQAGLPGTVNVVLAKSDAAALGVHGIALQRTTADGRGTWEVSVFDDPQSAATRRAVMRLLGRELSKAMTEMRKAAPDAPSPVHLVVPDAPTGDLLASIADNLAGIEISRLRWERDKHQGRPALTFDGQPADIPQALSESDRTAVSFLLEDDRARALTLRSPIVDVRAALAQHVVAGGPAVGAYRLDYLVRWAHARSESPLDHRATADAIESCVHTPGARLANSQSDAIHRALAGTASNRRSGGGPADPTAYAALVTEELKYKSAVLESALDALSGVTDSALREVHRAIEGDAQAVWRRRLELHASDLVRFGRTYRYWRNSLVPIIESDRRCRQQLLALANPQAAHDLGSAAGTRDVALATVVATRPLVLDVGSRRIGDGARIVLLHVNGDACVERSGVTVKHQAGSFRFAGLSSGPLTRDGADDPPGQLRWTPTNLPALLAGDRLVIADFAWFCDRKTDTFFTVDRPNPDTTLAPKRDCTADSYEADPAGHRWCCRPHEAVEAEWSDELAGRRARGELNPQAWPPVVDGDAFEVTPTGAPIGNAAAAPATAAPDALTLDDLD
jgi:hypothetical protein